MTTTDIKKSHTLSTTNEEHTRKNRTLLLRSIEGQLEALNAGQLDLKMVSSILGALVWWAKQKDQLWNLEPLSADEIHQHIKRLRGEISDEEQ
jgi:hypothetical protein